MFCQKVQASVLANSLIAYSAIQANFDICAEIMYRKPRLCYSIKYILKFLYGQTKFNCDNTNYKLIQRLYVECCQLFYTTKNDFHSFILNVAGLNPHPVT